MSALFVIGVIVLVVGSFVWLTNRGSQGDPNTRRLGMAGSGVAVVLIVASFVLGSFTTIPAGHRGVVIGSVPSPAESSKRASRQSCRSSTPW